MNNYISRIGASVKRVGQALTEIDDFADKYLFDPLGEGVCVCVRVCECMCACIYLCVSMYVCVCLCLCVCVCSCVCVCVCGWVCLYHVCVFMRQRDRRSVCA